MWVTYRPDDQDEQEWWLDLDDMGDAEAEIIESRSGWDWDEWKVHLLKGSTRARRALLWTLLKRRHPSLRYDDVHSSRKSFEIEFDAQELGKMIAGFEEQATRRALSDEEQAGLDAFRVALETARPAGRGKAPDANGA